MRLQATKPQLGSMKVTNEGLTIGFEAKPKVGSAGKPN